MRCEQRQPTELAGIRVEPSEPSAWEAQHAPEMAPMRLDRHVDAFSGTDKPG